MTREEAAEYFARKRDTLIWGLKDNRDETRQAHDAYNEAIVALCGPRPDPDTGLVPCANQSEKTPQDSPELFPETEVIASLGSAACLQQLENDSTVCRKNCTQFGPTRPGCWHCWNIEAHKIEYVTAVKDKDGRPMNTPVDIPYRYCPSCGRKLEVEG